MYWEVSYLLFAQSAYLSLPEKPGVYLFLDGNENVLYVGKAKNLKKRVASYFSNKKNLLEKTSILVAQIKKIKVVVVLSEIEALLLEAEYIKKYEPKYNIKLTDDKAYPLIRITTHDPYPKVLIVRRKDDPQSIYFGPYPNSSAIKIVMKLSRKIFPFQAVANHPKRVCLYHHLGLCPCPPVFSTPQFQKEYKRNIRYLIKFLSGNTKEVLKDLTRERDEATGNEQFELSALLQKQIDAVMYVTSPAISPFEYDLNPNLLEDLREKEQRELIILLQKNGVAVNKLSRIECYDISHTGGTFSTASMVVFKNGEKDAGAYRRFKIHSQKAGHPDDFASMREAIGRRMKHAEWTTPDLIIADGGKGQVKAVQNALDTLGKNIPLIGLAKREETIVNAEMKEILIPKNSNALKLLMRIRDEAHRFAITYHRKRRSKFFTA